MQANFAWEISRPVTDLAIKRVGNGIIVRDILCAGRWRYVLKRTFVKTNLLFASRQIVPEMNIFPVSDHIIKMVKEMQETL